MAAAGSLVPDDWPHDLNEAGALLADMELADDVRMQLAQALQRAAIEQWSSRPGREQRQ